VVGVQVAVEASLRSVRACPDEGGIAVRLQGGREATLGEWPRRGLLPLSSGTTQVGTTPSLTFRVLLRSGTVLDLIVHSPRPR
jgi:hypothetical protein